MSLYYPPLDDSTLKSLLIIRKLVAEHPDYFKESPYGKIVEDVVAMPTAPVSTASTGPYPGLTLNVVQELEDTYNDLKNHVPNKQDQTAVTAHFKTKTSLLEKLLENIEKGKNLKMISDFYDKVQQILDDVCTPTQRTLFQEQLKEWSAK